MSEDNQENIVYSWRIPILVALITVTCAVVIVLLFGSGLVDDSAQSEEDAMQDELKNASGSYHKCFSTGNCTESIQIYDKILQNYPDSSQAIYGLGISYYEQGDYEKSIQILDSWLADADNQNLTDKDYGRAYAALGWSYHRLKDERCLTYFDRALETIPYSPSVMWGKGWCLVALEEYDKAIAALEKANELYERYYPDSADAQKQSILHGIGVSYHHMQEYDKALEALDKAVDLDEHYRYIIYLFRSEVYYAMGEYEKALKCQDFPSSL